MLPPGRGDSEPAAARRLRARGRFAHPGAVQERRFLTGRSCAFAVWINHSVNTIRGGSDGVRCPPLGGNGTPLPLLRPASCGVFHLNRNRDRVLQSHRFSALEPELPGAEGERCRAERGFPGGCVMAQSEQRMGRAAPSRGGEAEFGRLQELTSAPVGAPSARDVSASSSQRPSSGVAPAAAAAQVHAGHTARARPRLPVL